MMQIEEHTWNYVFIRTDLPVEQQIVQACHAAIEAGHTFEKLSNHPASLIMLQVPNKEKLEIAMKRTIERGIRCQEFLEPDWDYGLTAFATEQITADKRKTFSKYKLWKAPNAVI